MIKYFMTHPCLPAGRPYSPLPEYSGGINGNHFFSFNNRFFNFKQLQYQNPNKLGKNKIDIKTFQLLI